MLSGLVRRYGREIVTAGTREKVRVESRPTVRNFPTLRVARTTMTTAQQAASDDVIRTALRSRLLVEHATNSDSVFVDELGLCRGQVRVDVAVVNGLLHAYEIKSDCDNLRRLAKQVDIYGRVVDRATIVVGDRLLECASEAVPAWWGVIRVRTKPNGVQLTTVRRPGKNPSRNPRALAELLWSADAISLLEERGIVRGIRGKPRRMLWDRVCEEYSVDEIARAVRLRLKARATRPSCESPETHGESCQVFATHLPNHTAEPRRPQP